MEFGISFRFDCHRKVRLISGGTGSFRGDAFSISLVSTDNAIKVLALVLSWILMAPDADPRALFRGVGFHTRGAPILEGVDDHTVVVQRPNNLSADTRRGRKTIYLVSW